VSYPHVCEPCRQALGLEADKTYLNCIRGKAAKAAKTPRRDVLKRQPDGKPFIIGIRDGNGFAGTNALCVCDCGSHGHDPSLCTGEDDFQVGGRPGSGFVDELADQFDMEPIPEHVAAQHEMLAADVRIMLAYLTGATDEQRDSIEIGLEKLRYEEQLLKLRDFINEKLPYLASEQPYRDIKANLVKVANFRNQKVAHSWPSGANWFSRVKREKAKWMTFEITRDEIAEHVDLTMALRSQIRFLPIYIDRDQKQGGR
jgi:hypothetical protein